MRQGSREIGSGRTAGGRLVSGRGRIRRVALLGAVLIGCSSLLAVTAPAALAAVPGYQVTGTVDVGKGAVAVAVNPITGMVYVADGNDSVVVFDRDSLTITATIPLGAGSYPSALAVDPSTNRIYATVQVPGFDDPGNVTVIDGNTNAVVDLIPVGYAPNELAVNPTTQTVYVTNGDDSVSVIDLATSAVTSFHLGSGGHGVAVNPATNTFYVASGVVPPNMVSVIDGSDNSITATIDVGQDNPSTPAINLTTGTVYVPHKGGHTDKVSVIDGTTVTATLNLGSESSSPQAVGVDSTTGTVYVVSDWDRSLFVLDGTTNALIATIPVGNSPWAVAVDSTTHTAYVGDANSGVVRVINLLVAQAIEFTSASPSDAVIGGSYTATATGGASDAPVVFTSDSTDICTVTAAGTVTFVGVGTCVINANQAAAGNYLAAVQVSQTIQVQSALATTTVVAADVYYVTAGQQVTLSATVSSAGVGTPTGSVSFIDGATNVGSGVLDGSGVATLPVDMLVAGAHSIVASYSGGGTFGGSVSPPATVTVFPAAVDHLVVSPPSATIVAGGDQAYTAATFDEFENLIGDVTDETVFTVDGAATCTDVTCTAAVAGDYTVTGAYEIPPVFGFAGAGFAALAAAPLAVGDTVTATAVLHVTAPVDDVVVPDNVVVDPPVAPDVDGAPPLAATGADVESYAQLSAIALMFGIGLLALGRSRRRS